MQETVLAPHPTQLRAGVAALLAAAAWKERVKGERKRSLELIMDPHENSMRWMP